MLSYTIHTYLIHDEDEIQEINANKGVKTQSYLNMLVISMPTKMTFTGNQTFINLKVNGSVVIRPVKLKITTMITETKFCNHHRQC